MAPPHAAAARDDGTIQGTLSAEDLWLRLPDDLLSMVYMRLASPVDCVRFSVVCMQWRAVVSSCPPRRAHPWLLLDPDDGVETKHVYNPGDGTILPLTTLLREADGCRFVGCHAGGWVAYEAPLRVKNVFTGDEVALPSDPRRSIVTLKVTFSGPPTLSGSILAAITDKHEVVICGLGKPECGWVAPRFCGEPVLDVTFCNGHLYCLMRNSKEVAKFEVGLDKYGVPMFGHIQWLAIQNHHYMKIFCSEDDPDAHAVYILELRGKLAMAVRRIGGPRARERNFSRPFFLVFKLVDSNEHITGTQCLYKWEIVLNVGDHALYLGPTCSKAMHVPTDQHGGPRSNHVYYFHHRCYTQKELIPGDAKEFFMSSNKNDCRVYYKEDESFGNWKTSVGYYVVGGAHPPMWLFP